MEKRAFKKFKKEFKLTDEEADLRWTRKIRMIGKRLLERAKIWKKYEDLAEEIGIDPKGGLDVEEINGEITINGIKVPRKYRPKEYKEELPVLKKIKNNKGGIIESMDMDIDNY